MPSRSRSRSPSGDREEGPPKPKRTRSELAEDEDDDAAASSSSTTSRQKTSRWTAASNSQPSTDVANLPQNGNLVPPGPSLLANVSKVALGFAAGLSTGNSPSNVLAETVVDEAAELAKAIKEAEMLSKYKSKQKEHQSSSPEKNKRQEKPKTQSSSWVSLEQTANVRKHPPKKDAPSFRFGLGMSLSKPKPGSVKSTTGSKVSKKAVVPLVFADDEDERPKLTMLNPLEESEADKKRSRLEAWKAQKQRLRQAEGPSDEPDTIELFMSEQVAPAVNGESDVKMEHGKGEDEKVESKGEKEGSGRQLPAKYMVEDELAAAFDSEADEENSDEETEELLARARGIANPKSKSEKLGVVNHAEEVFALSDSDSGDVRVRAGQIYPDLQDYKPFKKAFYIEAPTIKKMTEKEVEEYRNELGDIEIKGRDCPKPIKTWTQGGLPASAIAQLKKMRFERPTAIQAQAMPAIMSGRDVIGIAKTGSGKTLAFVLPMLRHIADQEPLGEGDGPITLIMAPTRELVRQIHADTKKFAKLLKLNSIAVYGGTGVATQIGELKAGAEIVVCTPGRMIDILCTSGGKITNLKRVTYLVLDEADRMFDMGFEPQITRIINNTRPDRQSVMFSATFPRQVEALARITLNDPVEIIVGTRSVANADIEQTVEIRPEEERLLRLLELLGEWFEMGKILVFTSNQDRADKLFIDLLKSGYACLSLHGGKDQNDRESTIADFKGDICNLLIATSVAARGLDVKELKLVVNYDPPNHLEDYVHRVGRTGRAGEKGRAVTFLGPEDYGYAPDLVKALKQSGQAVPEDLLSMAKEFEDLKSKGQAKSLGSGYGGKGFKFNEEEEDATREARKAQARAAGREMGLSDDEEEKEDDDDIKLVTAEEQLARKQAEAEKKAAQQRKEQGIEEEEDRNAKIIAALDQKHAAVVTGTEPFLKVARQTIKTNIADMMKRWGVDKSLTALDVARMIASTFREAIMKAGIPPMGLGTGTAKAFAVAKALSLPSILQTSEPVKEFFEAEMEINDFPQSARWKLTHKEYMAQITELTGAALVTKGVYVLPGQKPAPGERKLYVLIEGPTPRSVKQAKQEVRKILDTELRKLQIPGGVNQPSIGRYTV